MHNQWSARRKGVIFLITLAALVVIVGIPTYLATKGKPSCSNKIMDGDETGVDCGGSCQLLCTPETLPLIARGDVRLLEIATSTYVAVIQIENPNVNGEVLRAPYAIAVYSGTSRTPEKVFERETYIARNSTFALFEGPFALSGAGPYRAVFDWGELTWRKSEAEKPIIGVENMNFIVGSEAPRLEARLVNRSDDKVSNIEAVALLSDASGNTVAAGKTFVDSIDARKSESIVFSWPRALGANAVSIRILPHPLPDRSYIR